MELITTFLDFLLHVDKYLEIFVTNNGTWVYALLFAIIFVETGLVVMPFLPGDSLLFVVGAMCGIGLMNLPLSMGLLWLAAVLGNQSNYAIGRYFGPKVFQWEDSKYFNKKAFNKSTINFGVGTALNLGPAQLYLASDNIIPLIAFKRCRYKLAGY